jgi:hypothetical protein
MCVNIFNYLRGSWLIQITTWPVVEQGIPDLDILMVLKKQFQNTKILENDFLRDLPRRSHRDPTQSVHSFLWANK